MLISPPPMNSLLLTQPLPEKWEMRCNYCLKSVQFGHFFVWEYCIDTGSAIDILECGSTVLQIEVRVTHTTITVLSCLHLVEEIVLEWFTCTTVQRGCCNEETLHFQSLLTSHIPARSWCLSWTQLERHWNRQESRCQWRWTQSLTGEKPQTPE